MVEFSPPADPERPRLRRRVGVLDIGSNSVRFVVFHCFGASFVPTYNEKSLAGLGRSLRETGCLDTDGKAEALEALRRFRYLVECRDLAPVMMAATAAMREADDAPAFIQQVAEETGFVIRPTSGEEEARLAAQGVLAGDMRSEGLACDLGGASLELIELADGKTGQGVSLQLGPFAVVGTDLVADFDPQVQRPLIEAALEDVELELCKDCTLHLVGGAWRNLMTLHQRRLGYPLSVLQSYTVDADLAVGHCRWAYGRGREQVLEDSTISQRRRETLPYGALVLECLIARFGAERVRVSTYGVREGLVVDHLGELRRTRVPLHDGCRDLARGNLQAEGFARPLMAFLDPVSPHFPRAFEAANESRLRIAACHLAGMGKGLHPDTRAELVFENVLYAPVSGLLHEERAYLANIMHASLTKHSDTSNEDALRYLLRPHQRQAARVFGAAIRLSVAACGRAVELLPNLHLDWDWDGEAVTLRADAGYEELLSERVMKRLAQLNGLIGSG